jgi:hypothetical protein
LRYTQLKGIEKVEIDCVPTLTQLRNLAVEKGPVFMATVQSSHIFDHKKGGAQLADHINKNTGKLAIRAVAACMRTAVAEVRAGGPPMTPNSLGREPSNASLSTDRADRSQMLSAFAIRAVTVFPLMEDNHDDIPCSYRVMKAAQFSLVQGMGNPACLKPRSKNPPPVKKDKTGIAI